MAAIEVAAVGPEADEYSCWTTAEWDQRSRGLGRLRAPRLV